MIMLERFKLWPRQERGMEMTLQTIVVIILLLVTLLALIMFFQGKFADLTRSYDVLFSKADESIGLIPSIV